MLICYKVSLHPWSLYTQYRFWTSNTLHLYKKYHYWTNWICSFVLQI